MFAATIAGFSMGNVGTHLPHGLSYPVSAQAHSRLYTPPSGSGYPTHEPMLPHGMAVILHAPAVFELLGQHEEVTPLLGEALRAMGEEDDRELSPHRIRRGELISKRIQDLMRLSSMPEGLREVGFTHEDVPSLSDRAFAQKRTINNAPIAMNLKLVQDIYNRALSYQ